MKVRIKVGFAEGLVGEAVPRAGEGGLWYDVLLTYPEEFMKENDFLFRRVERLAYNPKEVEELESAE